MNEKISVIVPVYNVEAYIEKCVEKIENQTYKNFELILVDDGSSDNSGTLCDELSRKYSNISVYHQKNSGASAARNKGIDNAVGEFIVFCDSDDYIDNNMLQKLIETEHQYPDLTPLCGIRKISANKETDCLLKGDNFLIVDKSDFLVLQRAQLFNTPVNKLFCREILLQNGIRFNHSVSLGEDMLFNADYLMSCGRDYAVINTPLYFYNIDVSNSVSKKYIPHMLDDYLAMDAKIKQLIEYTNADIKKQENNYATFQLFSVVNSIKNTMLPQNTASASEKIKYIKKILDSFDINDIVSKADCSPYSDIYLKMLCTGNARLVYTFRTIRK